MVVMGIVSNLGATVVLLVTGGWRTSRVAPFMFGTIALALIAAALWPAIALRHAF
jgi:hypothetical protein